MCKVTPPQAILQWLVGGHCQPARSASSAPLLALGHGLEAIQKLPLRHGAGDARVQRDVGHGAEGDAGDDDFGGTLLVLPAAVDGDGWGLGWCVATASTRAEFLGCGTSFQQAA